MMASKLQLKAGRDVGNTDVIQRPLHNPLIILDVWGAAKRQMSVIACSIAIFGVCGLAYLAQAIPKYSSSVSILIDSKKVGMTAASPLEGSLTFETGAVDSQLEILSSDKLSSAVAQRLGLQNNAIFIDPPGSLVSRSLAFLSQTFFSRIARILNAPSQPAIMDLPENTRLLIATSILQSNMRVQRIGRTYVFALDYTDENPALAQSIAGQYANAYLEDQLDSKFDSTRRAMNWMDERIRELRTRSLDADEAVQQYRAANNLIAASGRLVDEQSLTDATTQLTTAKSALDAASARYQRLKEIMDTRDVNGSLTETISNPNVAALRAKYLDAAKLASDIAARYGENHQAAINARKDMEQYKQLMFTELSNLLPGYQSDVAIAQSQVNSIRATMEELRRSNSVNDSAMVKLRILEQEADTLKTLYSTFLQKSQEMQQQQSFPVTDARIISDPSTPLSPSSPKKMLVMLASLIMGLLAGVGLAAVREWKDRGFRTATQVRGQLNQEFISNIPLVKHRSDDEVNRPKAKWADAKGEVARVTLTDNPILQKVVDDPLSQFSEGIRAIRSKIGLEFPQKKSAVIGMISMSPDEGKTSIAKNLASSLALQGIRTILLDGDFRNPSLTNSLVDKPLEGIIDVLNGQLSGVSVLYHEQDTGLAFLPGATRRRQANDIFGGSRVVDLVDHLRKQFDFIVIDFPPVGALTDAVAANNIVDGYVLVVKWGKTPRTVVREFLEHHPQMASKILGVVLNQVDLKRLGRYGAYQGSAEYQKVSLKYFSKSHQV